MFVIVTSLLCHLIIQHFLILSEYIMNLIRISWTCKKVSYHYTIFLNIITIFSEYYSYMLKVQKGVISLYNIFEYHPNIFWILFVYVESAKHVSYHYITFLNIILIFFEYYSYMLKVQNNVIFIIQYFWILSIYFWNLICIYWKCKTGVIFIIQLYIFLSIIHIFSESYSYMI